MRVWVPVGTTAGDPGHGAAARDVRALADRSGTTRRTRSRCSRARSGSVIVTPDNSGVVQAGSYTAYAHRVINNTAFADTFDFRAARA